MHDSALIPPVFDRVHRRRPFTLERAVCPNSRKIPISRRSRQSGGWDLGPMWQSTLRITFGSLAAHTVLRILGPRRPTRYPSRHHPSWSSTTKATLFRPGAGKAGLDINGLRTNIASPWITRTSCGSWGMQTGNGTTPRISRMTIKFSSSRGRQFLMAIGKSGQTGSNATKYSKERRASASTPRQTKCSSATGMEQPRNGV